ncbi:4-hydroxybenzoate polyprenyl transferase [Penicillium odoratum]|uniref:4-hydroxybenzoate polyprenyl transferase n=1 Tax=Penicillium odoratum TaxID=1167516 RepID=UPI0025467284|nr:4-hydroxybenzoate polyprenyl transferase [Penicillium odoratum]KAJ5772365.1 4-hydroxybenzoate polyprenyl transferase [Penicillium odoratum]
MKTSSPKELPPPYEPPKFGFLSYLPTSWVPYAQLMRLDKPGGYYAFVFPYWIGLGYGASIALHPPTVWFLLSRAWLLSAACIFLRGAACTWNDNIDQDLDRLVARCRNRPIARGAVSTTAGHVFTATQTAVGSAAFFLLPRICILDAIPITALFALYPFGKRFTNYPQAILGFPFAFGIVLACHSIHVNPFALEPKGLLWSTIALVFANVFWTMVYDTIYAHQDREDDEKAGVKSMAVRFKESTKLLCSGLSIIIVALLATVGFLAKLGWIYYVVGVGGVMVSLGTMISAVNLTVPASCMWWFKWGFWYVGGMLLGGLLLQWSSRI